MIDPGDAAQPQDIPSIPERQLVKLKQKNFLIDGQLNPGSIPEIANQAGSNTDRSSSTLNPYSIPIQAIIQTQETEPKAAVSDEEQVRLLINKAEVETENTLSYYQKKIKEKDVEWQQLFEEVRNSVNISVKESQERFAAIKKEKTF
jgi:vacuolar-type H+-ATPase subunit I/STV1